MTNTDEREIAVRPQNAPLFILAPPRSFTSVICAMIGQHPELYGLPEVNLFAAEDYDGLTRGLYGSRPGFRHGLLRAIAELGLGGQTADNVEAAGNWLNENRTVKSAELFGDLAAWAAPRRLVDKSPIYVFSHDSLERIARAYPDAFFLHLTRHPRGTCESVYALRREIQRTLERFSKNRPRREKPAHQRLADVEDPESMWLEPHRRILDFLARVPDERKMRVRGEDFMSTPDRHLAKVCAWLDVDDSAAALGAMMHPEASPFACAGPMNARFGNDPGFMKNPQLRTYEPKSLSLEGPLAGGGGELSPAVIECADNFGYG